MTTNNIFFQYILTIFSVAFQKKTFGDDVSVPSVRLSSVRWWDCSLVPLGEYGGPKVPKLNK